MASYVKHYAFVEDLAEKVHNLASDTLKGMLTNAAPTQSHATKSQLTEISAGNGYTAGGATTSQSSSSQTSGTYKLVVADIVWTATGAIGPFRTVEIYNDTPTSPADPLIGAYDYGTSISLALDETFTTDFDATNGLLQNA